MKWVNSSVPTSYSIFQISVCWVVFIGLTILIAGILSSKSVRSQPFNLYVVALELFDAILNLTVIIIVATAVSSQQEETEETIEKWFWKSLQSLVLFSADANSLLSSIVSYHIFQMLLATKAARRINPPTIRRVLVESGIVSFISFCLAVAVHVRSMSRPHEKPTPWLVAIVPAVSLVYLTYVSIRVWKEKLLPLTGRTRHLAIYFGKIIFVFYALYLPGTICMAVGFSGNRKDVVFISEIIAVFLFSMQGAVSFLVAMTKPDIRMAVTKFLRSFCCCCCCCCSTFNIKEPAERKEDRGDDQQITTGRIAAAEDDDRENKPSEVRNEDGNHHVAIEPDESISLADENV